MQMRLLWLRSRFDSPFPGESTTISRFDHHKKVCVGKSGHFDHSLHQHCGHWRLQILELQHQIVQSLRWWHIQLLVKSNICLLLQLQWKYKCIKYTEDVPMASISIPSKRQNGDFRVQKYGHSMFCTLKSSFNLKAAFDTKIINNKMKSSTLLLWNLWMKSKVYYWSTKKTSISTRRPLQNICFQQLPTTYLPRSVARFAQ